MKAPPPFPVVAPPKAASGAAPVPHVAVAAEVPEAGAPAAGKKIPLFKRKAVLIGALAALILLGGGGFFAWKKFLAPAPAPVVVTPKAGAPVKKAPATVTAGTPATPTPMKNGPGTPSDTLNTVAQTPINAINKAEGVVAGRDASGQTKVEPIIDGSDVANKSAAPAGTKTGSPGSRPGGGAVTTLAPGLSATNTGDAGADATPAFRAWVGNLKVSSVIGGPAPKATINSRVIRVGEVVDGTLGVVLEGVDEGARQLIFKDKSGALLSRRY